ncbi:hypothetical protein [Nocardia sp. NPDC057272]|uniref:hypothetical protein n=1 Tax=Nocardia sp. NPDC057272 TaxID=3346079 RepID=UPI003630B6C0
MDVFASTRTFEVRRWGVGHSGLLLRSWKGSAGDPRIEILFKPADFVCLPSLLRGITIAVVTDGEVYATALEVLGRDLGQDENLFVVTSDNVSGWVVGGSANGRSGPESTSRKPMFDGWAATEPITDLFTFGAAPR